jgi:type IV secretory pathway TraG/TraD family ATPase VirD4
MTSKPHNPITYFGKTNARESRYRRFGIKEKDRLLHLYVIGRTGTGKSTMLETMIRQDIVRGEGCALIDPHGDLVARVAAFAAKCGRSDVVYFNVPDGSQPYGYNPLKNVIPDKRPLAASGMLEVFRKTWGEKSWGSKIEQYLRAILLALLDQEEATLADIPKMINDKKFRNAVVRNIQNESVKDFWIDEFEHSPAAYRAQGTAPILSKVAAFLSDPKLHRILTKPEQPLSFRKIMDEGQVLLVNLSEGQLGSDTVSLLGGLLTISLALAAFSRAETTERPNFWLYLDEFQNVSTRGTAEMLSEVRKFNLGAVLAHQYLAQLEPQVRNAVLGNAGSLVTFRLGPFDAPIIARELLPKFEVIDLLNLPRFHAYVRLSIDGSVSRPFSATTLAPWELSEIGKQKKPKPGVPLKSVRRYL